MKNKIELINRISELEAKVEAANKIIKKICGQCLNEKCTEGGDCHISDLKKALKIPRSEVPEEVKKLTVGRVPPHVMAKTVNPRKEAQDFCVEEMMNDKENTTP